MSGVSKPPNFKDAIENGDIANQYIYSGNSMHPVFKPGQMLYVRPLLDEPGVGDVIVFFDPSRRSMWSIV